MRGILVFIYEVFKIFVIALLIVIPIRYFIFQPFVVNGESMEPNFHNGDYLVVDEISYRLREPQRGEVIIFRSPIDPSKRFIKRIIGLPGETIEIKGGYVFLIESGELQRINELSYLSKDIETMGDIETSLGHDEYFVLGDNRSRSLDSRKIGLISGKDIIGRAVFRAWPLDDFARLEVPTY